MLIVTLTNLYPNEVQVRHGIFVRERLKHFLRNTGLPGVGSVVVAPIPWLPLRKHLRRLAAVPAFEQDEELGVEVHHPRYLAVPLLGNLLSPLFYAASVWSTLVRLKQAHPAMVIDAHFGFPDNAAAGLLGMLLKVPVVTTYRGSDLNQMASEIGINAWTRWILKKAHTVVTVSAALADRARAHCPAASRVEVVRNGVDATKFAPAEDRDAVREALGIAGPTLLSVGNLLRLKGHHLVIEALQALPTDYKLIIVGAGPEESQLKQIADNHGLSERVRFVGEMEQQALIQYYQAADVLVLASSREGLPNVVLEALSCGTQVVATDVGGIGEVLTDSVQGLLIRERSAASIAAAVNRLPVPENAEQRQRVRATVAAFDWVTTVSKLDDLFLNLQRGSRGCSEMEKT